MTVGIIDTSVFCNLLGVPGRDQDQDRAIADLAAYGGRGVELFLPLGVIYETGNHIAQVSGAHADRRAAAERFQREVTLALDGESPFSAASLPDEQELREWLPTFPDRAARTVGMTDLSILALWERLRRRMPTRRVMIWSYDGDLAGYDTGEI